MGRASSLEHAFVSSAAQSSSESLGNVVRTGSHPHRGSKWGGSSCRHTSNEEERGSSFKGTPARSQDRGGGGGVVVVAWDPVTRAEPSEFQGGGSTSWWDMISKPGPIFPASKLVGP